MSGPYVGQLGAFGLAKESVLGTFVAPARFIPIHLPMNIGSPDIDLLMSKGVRATPDLVYKAQQGAGSLKSGKIKFEVEPENIGEVLQAVFGGDTVTGAGPAYTHTFARAAVAQLPTYSLWTFNGLQYPTFVGCMLNKLDFDIKAPDFVIAEADFIGSKYNGLNSSKSLSYSTLNPFKFDQAVLTVGGSGVLLYHDVKLTFNNMVKLQPVIGGSIYSNVIFSEAWDVSLSATIIVEDNTEWAKFVAGTSSSFVVALTSTQLMSGTPYSLTFNLPNIQYKAAPMPLKNGLIEVTFATQGIYDTGTSKTANAVLVNSISSAY